MYVKCIVLDGEVNWLSESEDTDIVKLLSFSSKFVSEDMHHCAGTYTTKGIWRPLSLFKSE